MTFRVGDVIRLRTGESRPAVTPGRLYTIIDPPERLRDYATNYAFFVDDEGDSPGYRNEKFELAGPKVPNLSGFGKFFKRINTVDKTQP